MKSFHEVARPEAPGRRNPLIYGRVFFDLRKRFGLSVSEALLLDVVDTLSRRTGWCYASRAYLADMLGVSVRSVRRMLSRLAELGFVERHPSHARWIRPGAPWISARRGR